MSIPLGEPQEPASAADFQLARQSSEVLNRFLEESPAREIVVQLPLAAGEQQISIPAPAARLLAQILHEMGQGQAVTLFPDRAELTTQEAAQILGVSRPFLVEQLKNGALPYHQVGSHRRILLADLLVYKESQRRNRLETLSELSAQAQELNLGY